MPVRAASPKSGFPWLEEGREENKKEKKKKRKEKKSKRKFLKNKI